MQGKVPLWRPSKILTYFSLLASRIFNMKGPHNRTFSYKKFETIDPIKEYWVGMVK
jgi:hypothetical protein